MLGRKCLVTGASQGLGYAISHKLASMGASVTLVARNEEKLRRNLETLPSAASDAAPPHDYIKYDLSRLLIDTSEGTKDEANYLKLLESLSSTSVLINCAGLTTHCLLPKTPPSVVHSTINVNLIAPILLSQLVYKGMLREGASAASKGAGAPSPRVTPCIVNISSVLSVTGATLPGTAVYAASKAGLVGFTKSLSAELKGKVRVNSILPGLLSDTPMGQSVNQALGLKPIPLDDVSETVVSTILDENVNGQCIVVDDRGKRLWK